MPQRFERTLEADLVIALPRLHGPALPGLPAAADGFVAVDAYGRVRDMDGAWEPWLAEIGAFLDNGLQQQMGFDLNSFEKASGRRLTATEKEEFRRVQLRANRWTYLGTGMTHERVLETLEWLTPKARQRVESVSPAFC